MALACSAARRLGESGAEVARRLTGPVAEAPDVDKRRTARSCIMPNHSQARPCGLGVRGKTQEAAVPFGAFRFAAPPAPPETAGYGLIARAGGYSAPVVRARRPARPRGPGLLRPTREPGRNMKANPRPTQRRVHGNQLDMRRPLITT